MGQKHVSKLRVCFKCKDTHAMTAKELKAHAPGYSIHTVSPQEDK